MVDSFECFSCRKVAPLQGGEMKCPLCGGTNGEVINSDRVREGMKAGVFFNIDSKTGGRAKPKSQKR